jgi:hemoglobin/transferrin/lactoferrin receptor protein
MNKFILMWLYLGVASVAYSQTITIKEQETNDPLYLVVLMSGAPKANAATNANGQADISSFRNSDKIEIRMLGYKSLIKSYAELEAAGFEIFLEPSNLNLKEVVVAGTRWSQSSGNVPSKIISISLKELAWQSVRTKKPARRW